MTAIDGIKDMIREKKLAPYYVTGKISKHYLAMIHSFSALVEKLDPISKGELMPISHRAEKLNDDAIEAMV